MATNLRLRPEAERALREAAERTGRSQQELMREAIDRYLGLDIAAPGHDSLDDLIAKGLVIPAKQPLTKPHRRLTLPAGVTSLDLLDREDRI